MGDAVRCDRIQLSGHGCDNGAGNNVNQVYIIQGETLFGRPFYCGEQTHELCFYYEPHCHDQDDPHPIWKIGRRPNTKAQYDRDGGDASEGCNNEGHFKSDAVEPPLGPRKWDWVWCESHGCGGQTICLECLDNLKNLEYLQCQSSDSVKCTSTHTGLFVVIAILAILVVGVASCIILAFCICWIQKRKPVQAPQQIYNNASNSEAIQVQCPQDCGPGTTLQVAHPVTGQTYSLVVPPSVAPGGQFLFNIPREEQMMVGAVVVGQPVRVEAQMDSDTGPKSN